MDGSGPAVFQQIHSPKTRLSSAGDPPAHRAALTQHGLSPAFTALVIITLLAIFLAVPNRASATPSLVINAASGEVLYAEDATEPWYPASLTKLMTVYVALKAVREHRISLDTPLLVSAQSVRMPPSKMGFTPGTTITLGNALKILMVKSANDIAVTVAEGVSGSVEAFADEMNQAAFSLSLDQSNFVNPNGLPNPNHYSSARDMAVLARALCLVFPEYAGLFNIGALRLGDEIIQNHNNLLGRYPGADGMKTGFTCAAGFNIVASATRNGDKYIVVVLGEPNVEKRTIKTAALFDRAFAGIDRPQGSVMALASNERKKPPDPHFNVCRNRKKVILAANAELDRLLAPLTAQANPQQAFFNTANAMQAEVPMALRITLVPPPDFVPQPIFLGPPEGYTGPVAQARPAHSPVGTEAPPPGLRAYAEPKPDTINAAVAAFHPDPAAIPLKSRAKPAARAPRHAAINAKTPKATAIREAKAKQKPHVPAKLKPKTAANRHGDTGAE